LVEDFKVEKDGWGFFGKGDGETFVPYGIEVVVDGFGFEFFETFFFWKVW